MLELTEATRQRIHKLQELADKAEEEDGARRELRRRLREETPEVLARCSDFARSYRRLLAERSSGGNPLRKEAISERAGRMAIELAGDNPTPLEALLSERVASMWVLVELQEALMAAWYYKGGGTPMSVVLQMARLQESAHRRYLAAIKTLAQVQKLQGPSRVQVNIGGNQTNVSREPDLTNLTSPARPEHGPVHAPAEVPFFLGSGGAVPASTQIGPPTYIPSSSISYGSPSSA
jgi:hypothetical protein